MQFHPFAYIVKLKIEMSMADLISKVTRTRDWGVVSEGTFSNAQEGTCWTPKQKLRFCEQESKDVGGGD
jgi:hypothetical protein